VNKNYFVLGILLMSMFIMNVDFTEASTCNPTSPYITCYYNSDYDGYAKIQTTGMYSNTFDGKNTFQEQ